MAKKTKKAISKTDSVFLIDSRETAFMLGIKPRTLVNWRCEGRGPAYVRLGKKHSPVMYRLCDVEDWIIENQVKTSGSARR